jgi:hypothetical protein
MTRNPAMPAAQATTAASMTGSRRRRRTALITTANIRSHTRIGCTSASCPKVSATICRAKPARFPAIPDAAFRNLYAEHGPTLL